MKLKYYAVVPDVLEAIKYYQQLFDAQIIKGKSSHHGNIKLFGMVDLLLCQEKGTHPKAGYHVLRFNDDEVNLFQETVKRLLKDPTIEVLLNLYQGPWGTTLFEFRDRYGYTWDLEITSSKLKG